MTNQQDLTVFQVKNDNGELEFRERSKRFGPPTLTTGMVH